MVTSGSMPGGHGLGFEQFVDALARCALIGLSPKGSHAGPGDGGERGGEQRPPCAGERVQAIFVQQMNLLDDESVREKVARRNPASAGSASVLDRAGAPPLGPAEESRQHEMPAIKDKT